jgi:hypothetical protein
MSTGIQITGSLSLIDPPVQPAGKPQPPDRPILPPDHVRRLTLERLFQRYLPPEPARMTNGKYSVTAGRTNSTCPAHSSLPQTLLTTRLTS